MSDNTTNTGDYNLSVNGEDVAQVSNVDLSLNSTDNTRGIDPNEYQQEFSVSLDFDTDTETVVCPACNLANQVNDIMTFITREPIPCRGCGYPLL